MKINHLEQYLELSAAEHDHLCPRQVLGVRTALAGAAVLGMDVPRNDKKLLVIVETDGCFVDGIQAVTGCSAGHRTLRVKDYGKVAGTFIEVDTGNAVRVFPQLDVRGKAADYAPEEDRRYFAQLIGYQRMPDSELLSLQRVRLFPPVEDIISRPGVRVNCTRCGEEIINQREVYQGGLTLCQPCASPAYYQPLDQPLSRADPYRAPARLPEHETRF
ncbi:MAG: FmdE family protein [Anaerolineales bacterium]|nr:FmdE family protein [Anaerolineales bacterium]